MEGVTNKRRLGLRLYGAIWGWIVRVVPVTSARLRLAWWSVCSALRASLPGPSPRTAAAPTGLDSVRCCAILGAGAMHGTTRAAHGFYYLRGSLPHGMAICRTTRLSFTTTVYRAPNQGHHLSTSLRPSTAGNCKRGFVRWSSWVVASGQPGDCARCSAMH